MSVPATDPERQTADDLLAMASGKNWCVDLICCGRTDGRYYAAKWDAADEFRLAYTSGPFVNDSIGHERSAIIRALGAHP